MSGVSGVCARCGAEIESVSRHDYVTCECGYAMLDGGNVFYVRHKGIKPGTLRYWDWETADGRRLEAKDIADDHFRNIVKDYGERLGHAMKAEAIRRGLMSGDLPID